MNRDKFISIYWNYYLMLENDFLNITKYVKLEKCNYPTCSDEIIKLIEVTCSECDLIFKKICNIDLNDRNANITNYSEILKVYPQIVNEKIEVQHSNIILQPFEYWSQKNRENYFGGKNIIK